MPRKAPLPDPCDEILEEFFWGPIDRGSSVADTPLMRAYREEIDLIEDFQLCPRFDRTRSDLLWQLICAFAEVIP
jgi:hypothetical protein